MPMGQQRTRLVNRRTRMTYAHGLLSEKQRQALSRLSDCKLELGPLPNIGPAVLQSHSPAR
jgi:hypothetical protein